MKRILTTLYVLCALLASQTAASAGVLFNVLATGTPANLSITLCLNEKAPFTCRNYNVSALNLSLTTTTPNHFYPAAGIKINTPGYSITNAGLACTPSASGYCVFSVSNIQAKTFTIVSNSALVLSPSALPNGTLYTPYTQNITVTGGAAPYTFTVTSGTLPAGLTLNPNTGVISGTPITDSNYAFTIEATDSNSISGSNAYSISISGPLAINPPTLPQGHLNTAYSQTITASGGVAPYVYTITSGSLPAGLTLNPTTGLISGTPVSDNTYPFTIKATDSQLNTGSEQYSINISGSLALNPSTLPRGALNTVYNQTITASGGVGPYTYTVSSGTLPTGLSLNTSTGVISGTPTSDNTYPFTIKATDLNSSDTGSEQYSINISGSLTLNPSTLPQGALNTVYNQTITASGGVGPYTYTVSSGTLPTGLSLNTSTGVISGTPTSDNTYPFTIKATDLNSSDTGSEQYSINISGSLALNPPILPQGHLNTAYSQTITASGGVGPYTYTVSSGTLPTGLSLNTSTGVISGTPTSDNTYPFTIKATDLNSSDTGSEQYSINISGSLTLNPSTLPQGALNTVYNQTITASGGVGPYTYTVSSGTLPTGLSLNTSTGVISGTPTSDNTYPFTIKATDLNSSDTGSEQYSINISGSLTLNPSTLPQGALNTVYNQTITASGGVGPYTYTVSSGTLPTGLSLNASTGVISGTPTSDNTYPFTIKATDLNSSDTGSKQYSINISGSLTLNPSTLPQGALNTVYNQTITASGGVGPYTYTVSSGTLPTGLSLNTSTGVISGTPTSDNTYPFTIKATDLNSSDTGSEQYSINISGSLTLNPSTLPQGALNTVYNQTITASGGVGPYTYTVSSGTLPTGLSLNTSTGVISGTPTSDNTYPFTIKATDLNSSDTGSEQYSINISGSLTLNPSTLPQGALNTVYNQTITASGGVGPYTYTVSSGTLPTGLSLNTSTGVISGTPTSDNTYPFTIKATDLNSSDTGSEQYSINISGSLTLNPSTLPRGALNTVYNQTITASGGVGPYTYTVSSGTLPTGLSLNASTGVISGTPTSDNTYPFTIKATDLNSSDTGSKQYSINISGSLTLNPSTLPQGALNTVYNQTITASGGVGPYTYTVSSGTLPTGLSLNTSTGVISGTPTSDNTYPFTIKATDLNSSDTGSEQYSINISGSLTLNPSTLPQGALNTVYNQTITASGGVGPYTYTVSSGTLPTGLSLNTSTGVISGTPTSDNTYPFTIKATDLNSSDTGSKQYSINISGSLTLNPSTLPQGALNTVYNQTITASGGVGPYTYTVSSGTLPTGLSLNTSTGVISGTPTSDNTYPFTIKATDLNSSDTGSEQYSINISGSLTLNPSTLPQGALNTVYNQTITASGGVGPYTYTVSSGTLPTGLSLNTSTGVISGTPTSDNTYPFTIKATDLNSSDTGSKQYSINISGSLTLNPSTLPRGALNTVYNQTITASGGVGPYTYTVSSGTLPTGLSLNTSTGVISGTPTSDNTYPFTIKATDLNSSDTGSKQYSINISGSLTLNPSTLPQGALNTVYNQTITASGGVGPYTYTVSSGTLPTGLSLNTSTGVISGTPTSDNTYPFTIKATDLNSSDTGSEQYSINISGSLTLNPSTLPQGALNTVYNQTITASGGVGPYTYAVTSGTLPTGLTLYSNSGVISGTPKVNDTYTFTIKATDSNSSDTGSQNYTMSIGGSLALNPTTLPAGALNSPYFQTITASGGFGPYNYAVTSGSLPTGLSLNPNSGVISGTPIIDNTYPFTITATDTNSSDTGSEQYSVNISGSLTLSPLTLPPGALDTTYNQTITASGGVGPYTYAVSSGTLPTGLSLNTSTGVISGTPTSDNTYTFTIKATDLNSSDTGSKQYSINISGSLTLSPLTLPPGALDTTYNQTITASGGVGPYTYTVSSGSIPTGLTLNANTGVLSGTATSYSTYPFTIKATDQNSNDTGYQSYSVLITGTLVLNPPRLSAGIQGSAYSQIITTSGGTGPYTYSILSGTLPNGLSLNNTTGEISGTPTTATTYSFTILATDSETTTNSGSQAYSIQIVPSTSTVLSESIYSLGLETSGTPRTISISNTGSLTANNVTYTPSPALPNGTSISPATCGNIAPGGTCQLTITPGSTPSAEPYNITPTPITLTIQGTNTSTITPTLNIVTLGSVYQSGFIYTIDDTTPTTGSIGGNIIAVNNQSDGIIWSSTGSSSTSNVAIYGISDTSTPSSPNPSSGQIQGQTACDGLYDGPCDTQNIIAYYNANRASGGTAPTPLNQYASGLCKASIGGYTNWYLPAICEMGYYPSVANCAAGTPNIATSLPELIASSCTGSSCLYDYYWSSTEYSVIPAGNAWDALYTQGNTYLGNTPKSSGCNVRCTRALTP